MIRCRSQKRRCSIPGMIGAIAACTTIAIVLLGESAGLEALAQPLPEDSPPVDSQSASIQELARLTAVRILAPRTSGSGAIVDRQGQVYTVLTNWHVVAFKDELTIIAPDGQGYAPIAKPQQLGTADMAIVRFRSTVSYRVARVSTQPAVLGEPVYAAGFPMYRPGSLSTTFDLGIRGFRFTRGRVSLLPPKSLDRGYRLGYSNDIEVGMSGGSIFNDRGLLIGINGRVKYRDPGFGVYTFEDGTEPSPTLLEQMVRSSWGIPISTYFQFISRH